MTMSASDFRKACQDLAVREYGRHQARIDAIETQRALEKYGAPQPRQNERLRQVDAKIAELQKQQQDPGVACKLAALEEIRKEIA
jgi:hypothetical protein